MNSKKEISLIVRALRGAAFPLLAVVAPLTHAATVWDGPLITYSQPGTDPTQAANQDRLTPNVSLTRNFNEGLFNAVKEAGFNRGDFSSPTDTEWAYGTLANYASHTYTTWTAMSGKNPPTMVGKQAVLHFISEDIYLSVKFTAWGGAGSGFSYQRSTPAVVSPPPTVSITITNPASGSVFTAPANVNIAANVTVSSGSVTNVTFFGNDTLLGAAQASPFSITASNLAAGAYALTAVATAAGTASTSAVVNITVVSPVALSVSAPEIKNGQFSFNYTADPGLTYVIQNSSNLVDWLPVATNVASSNPVRFTNGFIADSLRLYRVGRLPNP